MSSIKEGISYFISKRIFRHGKHETAWTFMDESTTDMGHEECTDQIAFRNGNFMHFPATQPGVYMFFGMMPGTEDITYSGLVRLGDDILADWQGSTTEFGIPMANMNWLESSALFYPFCD